MMVSLGTSSFGYFGDSLEMSGDAVGILWG